MGHPMCCWYYRIFYKKICPVQNLYTICFTLAYLSGIIRYFRKNTNNALEPVPVRVIRNGLLASDQVVFQTAVLDEVQRFIVGERENVSDILRSEHCIHSLPRNFVWQGSPDPPVYGGPEP